MQVWIIYTYQNAPKSKYQSKVNNNDKNGLGDIFNACTRSLRGTGFWCLRWKKNERQGSDSGECVVSFVRMEREGGMGVEVSQAGEKRA